MDLRESIKGINVDKKIRISCAFTAVFLIYMLCEGGVKSSWLTQKEICHSSETCYAAFSDADFIVSFVLTRRKLW